MRPKRLFLATTALALGLAGLAVTAPAGLGATPRVRSITATPSKELAGEPVVVSGTVAGLGAHVTIDVESRVGSGAWSIVGTASRHGQSFRFRMIEQSSGLIGFRVVLGTGRHSPTSRVVHVRIIANGVKAHTRRGVRTVSRSVVRSVIVSAGGTTTTIVPAADAPPVGGILIVNATATSPGVMGRVISRKPGSGDTVIVVTTPVSFAQAYSSLQVAFSQSIPVSVQSSALGPAAHVTNRAAAFRNAGLLGLPITCDSGSGPSFALGADNLISSIRPEFTMNLAARTLHFAVSMDPTFTATLTSGAHVSCSLDQRRIPHWIIPIPDTPLEVTISPTADVTVGGQFTYTLGINVPATFGADVQGGHIGLIAHINARASVPSISAGASVSADAFAGVSAQLGVGGVVGIGGDGGLDFSASHTVHTDASYCDTVGGGLRTHLTATVNLFFWTHTWTLATADLYHHDFYNHCSAAPTRVVFDGSPGIGTPPVTLGPYTMAPFVSDPQATATQVSDVAGPTGTVSFAPTLDHELATTPSWSTWSNGYTSDVYGTTGSTITISLPAGTKAFYFYAEPQQFQPFSVEAVTSDGTDSQPITVQGQGGAQYFGFYATGATDLSSLTVTCADPNGFAVGEFGIAS